MMPQRTPAYSISARCAMLRDLDVVDGSAEQPAQARSVATSSAALDDRPTPIGTSDSTWMSSGGTARPASRDLLQAAEDVAGEMLVGQRVEPETKRRARSLPSAA